jgi:hypothetical protein
VRHCIVCGNDLPHGLRADAAYCSVSCRMRALRARAKGLSVGVTQGGYTGVTDNPTPSLAPPLPRAAQSEPDAKYPIPDDLTIPRWLRRDPDAPHWKLLDEEAP